MYHVLVSCDDTIMQCFYRASPIAHSRSLLKLLDDHMDGRIQMVGLMDGRTDQRTPILLQTYNDKLMSVDRAG